MGHPDGRGPRTRTHTHTHPHTRAQARARDRAHAHAHAHTHTPQHANANASTHTHMHANAPRIRTRARARARTRTYARTRDDPPRQSAATVCVFLDGLESLRSKKTRTERAWPAPQAGGAKRVDSGAPTSTASPRQRRPRGSHRHPPGEHNVGPDISATQSCQIGLWPMTGLRSEGGAHHGPLSAATSAQPLGCVSAPAGTRRRRIARAFSL